MSYQQYELHVGDIGTSIVFTLTDSGTAVDLTSMTSGEILVSRPNGTAVALTAVASDDPTDGTLTATSIASTFSIAGQYELQARVTIGAWTGHSEKARVMVNPVITIPNS